MPDTASTPVADASFESQLATATGIRDFAETRPEDDGVGLRAAWDELKQVIDAQQAVLSSQASAETAGGGLPGKATKDLRSLTEVRGRMLGTLERVFHEPERDRWTCRYPDGRWVSLKETALGRDLDWMPAKFKSTGFDCRRAFMTAVQRHRYIDYAGPLAGRSAGAFAFNRHRMLVTTSPAVLRAEPGPWPTLRGVVEGLLGPAGGPESQLTYFHAYVRSAYESLVSESHRPGQALVLVGNPGVGKSLLQLVVLKTILGGRTAKPFQYMTGATPFNADLIGAELLVMEDERAALDNRSRTEFAARIKDLVVNTEQRVHRKGCDAFSAPVYWRLTVSVNGTPEHIRVLPPFREGEGDDSLADKIIAFWCTPPARPFPTGTLEQRKAFERKLIEEVPGYLHWLLNNFKIPDAWRRDPRKVHELNRYGVPHYHDPRVIDAMAEADPATQMLDLLDAVLWRDPDPPSPKELPLIEIEARLMEDNSYGGIARRLLSWSGAAGMYLGKLAVARPNRVEKVRSGIWRIHPPAGVGTGDALTK